MGTVIDLIQDPIKHVFTNFRTLQNVQSKFKKVAKICKQVYKDTDLKIAFTSFRINDYFSTKGKTPYFSSL